MSTIHCMHVSGIHLAQRLHGFVAHELLPHASISADPFWWDSRLDDTSEILT